MAEWIGRPRDLKSGGGGFKSRGFKSRSEH